MKQKTIVLIVLIFLATSSSAAVLYSDGYFNKKSVEHKILASQEQSVTKPIVLAKETTSVKKPAIVKKPTVTKKAPVKKVIPKKKVVKKKSVNLAPPVFTPQTAPFSSKNRYN
jgi:hypothetical protein